VFYVNLNLSGVDVDDIHESDGQPGSFRHSWEIPVRGRCVVSACVVAVAGMTGFPAQAVTAVPMSPEACLSRSASQITDLNGDLTGAQGLSSTQVDRTWDLRDFSQTSSPNPTRYPFSLGAAKRVCIIGGSVIGNIPRDYSREQFYDNNSDGIEWDNEGYRPQHTADSPWVYQYGSYAENVSDAFDPNGLANGVNHTYLDRVHAKDIRDDCVEVEGEGFSPHTITITRSLFDGCSNFLSMRPSGTSHADAGTTDATLTIEDSLAYVRPNELGASNCTQVCTTIGGVPYMGNHVLFKWSSAAAKNVVVRNTVFRVDQPSAFSSRAMHWPAGVYENVTLVWTWPKPYTDYFDVPAGVKVTSDVKVWEDAKTAWLANDATQPPVVTTDTKAPSVVMTAPVSANNLPVRIVVSWKGTDPLVPASSASGVASFDVRYRKASWNASLGAFVQPASWRGTIARSTSINGVLGVTYCFSARARDRSGNVSGWSGDRCTARPLDDRSLTTSAGWVQATGSGFYNGTVTKSRRKGAVLTRTGVRRGSQALVATRCSTCGAVGVYYGGKLVSKVSLVSAKTARQSLIALPIFTATSGTVQFKVLTAAKPVQIDGLAS